ncbi:TolC family protein [Sandaracinobacter neustonicus]|uniref:TolC family protein n=1 Tax=Sandaracinobacter neustonicus TaxID=1715348 RepID=A0A501XPK3_9SPHN|nr:TolC family protein [Sandaracinobacter neustonicus]
MILPRRWVGAAPVVLALLCGTTVAAGKSPDAAAVPALIAPVPAGTTLTLDAALQLALQQAPVIRAGAAGVEAEQGRLKQAGLLPNPQIQIDIEDFGGSGPYSGTGAAQVTTGLAMPLELGGKRGARVALGRQNLASAQAGQVLLLADLGREVRVRFASALAATEIAALSRKELETAREIERTVGLLVDGGREPPLRLVTARTERARAESALADAEARAAVERAALSAIIGYTGTAFVPVGESHAVQLTDVGRPDLVVADTRVAAAEATLRLERSQRIPDPTLNFGVRQYRGEGESALVAGVSLPFPLFNRNGGNIAAARAEVRRAEAERDATRLALDARTTSADAEVQAASARARMLETEILPGATEALRISRAGYTAGRFSYLDLLAAQRAVAEAGRGLAEARRDRAIAEAERDRALGRTPFPESNS